jgi:hypothetical protein
MVDTFGGPDSNVWGINDSRVAVGFARDASNVRQPIRIVAGQVTRLPPLPGYTGGAATAINSDGSICGWSARGDGNVPTLWLDGQPIALGAAPGGYPFDRCLGLADDEGLAAGVAFSADFSLGQAAGYRYGDVIDISLGGYGFSYVYNVNRRGIVAGYGSGANPGNNTDFAALAFSYDLGSGARTTFEPLAGDNSSLLSVVTAGGTIYGYSWNDRYQRVVAFDPRANGTGTVLNTEETGAGWLVANDTYVIESYTGARAAQILVNGGWIPLDNCILNPPQDGRVLEIDAINAHGDLVGSCRTHQGATHGCILEIQGN